jgi:surface polysaccharide O-acyltransferase-like enzyme
MATPIVRTIGLVDALPVWLQWYVRPSGDNTTFTSFPWIGFVFAGAAVGVLLAGVREPRGERRRLTALGVIGALVIAAGFYAASRPSIYAESSFWTTSPAYFAIRAGILMTALAVMFAAEQAVGAPAPLRMLAYLGRSSLFVYWIHVELVYGYASWPLRRHLPLWGTAIAYVIFTLLMILAVRLRDRLVDRWQKRHKQITFQYKAEAV